MTRKVSTTSVRSLPSKATSHAVKIIRAESEHVPAQKTRLKSNSKAQPSVNGDAEHSPWHVTAVAPDNKPKVTERRVMLTTEL